MWLGCYETNKYVANSHTFVFGSCAVCVNLQLGYPFLNSHAVKYTIAIQPRTIGLFLDQTVFINLVAQNIANTDGAVSFSH